MFLFSFSWSFSPNFSAFFGCSCPCLVSVLNLTSVCTILLFYYVVRSNIYTCPVSTTVQYSTVYYYYIYAEAARLDGAALGETAGTLTKRQSNIFKKATCNYFKHLEKKLKLLHRYAKYCRLFFFLQRYTRYFLYL